MPLLHAWNPELNPESYGVVPAFTEWKPFPVTGKPYLTPREEIPPAFRSRPSA